MALGEYLGAGSGTTKLLTHLNGDATDSSGNGNNGTPTNIIWTGGILGSGSASGNGSNAYINIPNPTNYNFGTNSFSIKMSIKGNSGIQYQYPLIRDNTGASPRRFYAIEIHNNTTLQPYLYDSSNGGPLQVSTTIELGKTYHIIFQRNRTNGYIELFVNGKKVSQALDNGLRNMDVSSGVLLIFAGGTTGGYYNGLIDEVVIESKIYTSEEALKDYTYSKGVYGIL